MKKLFFVLLTGLLLFGLFSGECYAKKGFAIGRWLNNTTAKYDTLVTVGTADDTTTTLDISGYTYQTICWYCVGNGTGTDSVYQQLIYEQSMDGTHWKRADSSAANAATAATGTFVNCDNITLIGQSRYMRVILNGQTDNEPAGLKSYLRYLLQE
jgi:hypothetical protein